MTGTVQFQLLVVRGGVDHRLPASGCELVRTELQQLRDLMGAEDATFELDGEGEPN